MINNIIYGIFYTVPRLVSSRIVRIMLTTSRGASAVQGLFDQRLFHRESIHALLSRHHVVRVVVGTTRCGGCTGTGHEWDRFFTTTEVATDDFLAERATPEIPKAVMDHWDRMVAAMQMPQQKAAEEALFRATPEELGKAAVRATNLKTKNTT